MVSPCVVPVEVHGRLLHQQAPLQRCSRAGKGHHVLQVALLQGATGEGGRGRKGSSRDNSSRQLKAQASYRDACQIQSRMIPLQA